MRTAADDDRIAKLGRDYVALERKALGKGRAVTIKEHIWEAHPVMQPGIGAYLNEHGGEAIHHVKRGIVERCRSISDALKRKRSESEILAGMQDPDAKRIRLLVKQGSKRRMTKTDAERKEARALKKAAREVAEGSCGPQNLGGI